MEPLRRREAAAGRWLQESPAGDFGRGAAPAGRRRCALLPAARAGTHKGRPKYLSYESRHESLRGGMSCGRLGAGGRRSASDRRARDDRYGRSRSLRRHGETDDDGATRSPPAEIWQQPSARVLERMRRLRPLDDARRDAAGDLEGATTQPPDAPRVWLQFLSRFSNPPDNILLVASALSRRPARWELHHVTAIVWPA